MQTTAPILGQFCFRARGFRLSDARCAAKLLAGSDMAARDSCERTVLPNRNEATMTLAQVVQVAGGADMPFGIVQDQIRMALKRRKARDRARIRRLKPALPAC